MASFDVAKLLNRIKDDIPGIKIVLTALAKWDISALTDIPNGAMQATTNADNQMTFKKLVGSSWTAVRKLMHDVDMLDGYHASTSATKNTVPVRGANGALPGNITGNAATASEAARLSPGAIVPVNQGGTGATTASKARENLGVTSNTITIIDNAASGNVPAAGNTTIPVLLQAIHDFLKWTKNTISDLGVINPTRSTVPLRTDSGAIQAMGLSVPLISGGFSKLRGDVLPVVWTERTPSVTGTLLIKVPISATTSTMLSLELIIYLHERGASKIILGGYAPANQTGGPQDWRSGVSATVLTGSDIVTSVRLARSGSDYYILFNSPSFVWRYPAVYIQFAGGGFSPADLSKGWEISITASEPAFDTVESVAINDKLSVLAEKLSGQVPVSNGGTGQSTAAGALSALGGVSASDSRLSDARTPKAHTHAVTDITGVVGDLYPSLATSRAGCLHCNGAAVSRTTYATLYALLGTTFGAGNGSTTFNVPDLRGRTAQGAKGNLMAYLGAGLPNITGRITIGALIGASSGALYNSTLVGSVLRASTDSYTQESAYLDASRSSSIYGNSTTVQPPAIAVNWFIKY